MKASTLNNIVSCVQDAYGVYKSNNQGSAPSIGVCACQGSAPSIGVCASLIDPQRSEDFDPAEYQQALDTFVHGFFMDEPDRQVLVIYGLPGDSVNMLNAQGADVDASEWMSAGEALVIYILPPEEDFTLEVDTDQPFDIAFYEAGVDETTRQTYRHSQQPSDVITATMDLGANTDLTLQIDADQDGQVDQSLPPESFTLDVVPPTITNIEPAHESSVSQTPLSLLVQFSDNAGGSGIDPESVRVVFDGEDRSGDAAITEEGLFLDLGVLGEGEHTAEVRVYDKDGNLARVEWTFSVGSGLWILSGLVFIAILGGGALLLLGTAVFVVILIARRKSSQKLSKASAPQQNIPPQEAVRSGSGCLLTLVLTALLTLVVFGVLFLIVFEFIPWLKIPVLGGANLGDILKIGGIGILITFLGVLVLNSGIKSVRQTGQATGALNVLFGVISIIFGLLMLLVGLGLIALALYQQVLPYLGY
jgi:hypothetical protein